MKEISFKKAKESIEGYIGLLGHEDSFERVKVCVPINLEILQERYSELQSQNTQILETIEKTKAMYFDNLQAKDNEIAQLLETIESLKCCGNCTHWADSINGWFCTNKDSEKPNGDFRNSKCSKWSEVVGLKK